jgi:hypothetical protein
MNEVGLDYALSFHDLSQVDGFPEALSSENKKVFDAILYANGMETYLGYEIVTKTHRTLVDKIVWSGPRVEGFERIDAAWIATGAASRGAEIKSIKDLSLRKELRNMSRERTYDLAFDE